MNHLPSPNWDLPPKGVQNSCFPTVSNFGCGRLPFMPTHDFKASQPYASTYQTFVPRPLFREDPVDSQPQCGELKANEFNQSTKPTKKEFTCDSCERFFKSQKILETHLQTHENCDYEGCSFQASRKMMKLHFIQNHAVGRMRIKLDTPQDIQKWREQRRKNYPTAANVKKKLEEEKARYESGQLGRTQNFRHNGRRQKYNSSNKNWHSKYQSNAPPQHDGKGLNNCNKREDCQQTKRSNPLKDEDRQIDGDPLSAVLGDNKSESDNEVAQPDVPPSIQPSTTSGAGSALMALSTAYGGDSSEEESDTDTNTDTSKEINNNDKEIQSREQNLPIKMSTAQRPLTAKGTRKRKQDFSKNVTLYPKKKATLLEKLLAPEIRHENSVILQCLRYIVNNDYFGVATESNSWQPTK